ncbi:MAG: adenylate/guanylate cyclase domain-containing protein [Actinomycetota bacterium]|nr:adenylate/guanylate cyclase domain-containing protein [Actinomycetota bacterium]MDH5313900.1 adenylate/guanylate cyclase domain-containing protein [Actinomycetota bacterium]
MAERTGWRRAVEPWLSIGEVPSETETQRGGRRVLLVAIYIGTILSIPTGFADLDAGYTRVAVATLVTTIVTVALGLAAWRWPRLLFLCVQALAVAVYVSLALEATWFGGLVASGLSAIFGLGLVLAAMVGFGYRVAAWWFGAFVVLVVYALVVPDLVDPIYAPSDPTGDIAFNLVTTGVLTFAVLTYFIRQRDRFQRRSDELLHAILPDEIVPRMKDGSGTIADDVDAASVLFADVVDFTPMSAALTPAQLVELLDEVFSCFDAFVDELGLEKIKTVGDAYMAAAGVPHPRADHAHAIAELALRIRDHQATNPVDGGRLAFRIGVNSGPVTAGVIGTRTFSYDLWGDTVNTASRMESSGVPGEIQITAATCELVRDAYVCESRGSVQVKGKSEMQTYLLLSRRGGAR